MSVTIVSSDSKEEVLAALGRANPKEEVNDAKSASAQEKNPESDETPAEDSETTAKDQDEDSDLKEESTDEDDSKDEPKKKEGKGFRKRIDGLRAERDHWKAEALKGARVPEPKVEAKQVEAKPLTQAGKPKQDDFASHEEWVEAVADWKFESREKEKEAKDKEDSLKAEFEKQKQSFHKKYAEAKKSIADYDDVIDAVSDIVVPYSHQEAVMASDLGPQVMYELAKDPEALEKFAKMSRDAANREIGKIEARLEKSQSSETIEPKKTTKAPAPINPVGNKGTTSVTKPLNDPRISFAEYEKQRIQQLKAKQ